MSKAEEALKAYCDNCRYRGNCAYLNRGMESKCLELDTYSSGYEQAEEDLALTENDMHRIVDLWIEIYCERKGDIIREKLEVEVTRRFNEEKGNKA